MTSAVETLLETGSVCVGRDEDGRLLVGRALDDDKAWLASTWAPTDDDQAAALFRSGQDRYLTAELFQDIRVSSNGLSCHGERGVQLIRPTSDGIHVTVSIELPRPRLDYALSAWEFLAGAPDFVHTPGLTLTQDDIAGDRTFHSPAAIVQRGADCVALLPDLEHLQAHPLRCPDARQCRTGELFTVKQDPATVTFPTGLRVDVDAAGTGRSTLAFGLIDAVAHQHVWWRHANDGSMARALPSTAITFAYYLDVSTSAASRRAYQRTARRIWALNAPRHLADPRPQVLPFADYAQVCIPAAKQYRGEVSIPFGALDPHARSREAWQQWESDGRTHGGFCLSPRHWYDDIAYLAWWNAARTAVGLDSWGRRLGDDALRADARTSIDLALTSMSEQGIPCGVYRVSERRWYASYFDFPDDFDFDGNGPAWNLSSTTHQLAAASKTTGYLLRYVTAAGDPDGRIEAFARRYLDRLVEHAINGCPPAWIRADGSPSKSLQWNAEGGIHVWALAEGFRLTGTRRYLDAAQRCAQFLVDEVLPDQRWLDFECFYSCARKPESYVDPATGQPPRNTMSMIWAIDGLCALAEVEEPGDAGRRWLAAAEAVADYASLFQSCWQPPFVITAYAFGGMTSQNTDCEWLDMRGGQLGEAFARLGIAVGRQDLLERAVALVRAQYALTSLEEHVDNAVQISSRFPRGISPENIDHDGRPQEAFRTGPDWGEMGGVTASATLLDLLGSAYVDLSAGLAVGVDGVDVEVDSTGMQYDVQLTDRLHQHPVPSTVDRLLDVRIQGVPVGAGVRVCGQPVAVSGAVLEVVAAVNREGEIQVAPDGCDATAKEH